MAGPRGLAQSAGETPAPRSCIVLAGKDVAVASTEVLGTYLNDHLAGANAGIRIAAACRSFTPPS